ncbi:MAG: hypothetical protein J4G04_05705, partial [Nitrosopumilaceae archaeon]|nr:hypothetical protein [Nitrosopumilaceae archaeon]
MAGRERPKNGAPSRAVGRAVVRTANGSTVRSTGRRLQGGVALSDRPPPGAKLAPYRNEIARLFGVIDGCHSTIRELRDEVARVRAESAEEVAGAGACAPEDGICAHAAEAMRLQDEVARLQ